MRDLNDFPTVPDGVDPEAFDAQLAPWAIAAACGSSLAATFLHGGSVLSNAVARLQRQLFGEEWGR